MRTAPWATLREKVIKIPARIASTSRRLDLTPGPRGRNPGTEVEEPTPTGSLAMPSLAHPSITPTSNQPEITRGGSELSCGGW